MGSASPTANIALAWLFGVFFRLFCFVLLLLHLSLWYFYGDNHHMCDQQAGLGLRPQAWQQSAPHGDREETQKNPDHVNYKLCKALPLLSHQKVSSCNNDLFFFFFSFRFYFRSAKKLLFMYRDVAGQNTG